jgi:hypothetical protein
MDPQVTTTPEAPAVEKSEASLDDRLLAKFGYTDDSPQAAEEQSQPQSEDETPSEQPQDPDALSPDEVAAEEQTDAVELTHNGQKIQLPKEEVVKLAQQGFDYTQKTQALAEERRAIEAERNALKARATLTPQLLDAAGVVKALQQQMAPYAEVNWTLLAQQDPSNYPSHHANYVQLQQSYQKAVGQLNEVWQKTQQTDKVLTEADAIRSWNQMLEKVPVWRDPQRRVQEQKKVWATLEGEGYTSAELESMTDPRVVALARKAMLYDEAVKARSEKGNNLKQMPSVRPGGAPPRVTPESRKADLTKQLHQAKDPTRKKALLDDVLALKFGLK